MNLPSVPPAALQPDNAELIIIFLVIIIGFLVKFYISEKKRNSVEAVAWRERIEDKLDLAISSHDLCQKELPYKFVTKEEFKDLLSERNRQWKDFNEKFDRLLDRFWNHSHDNRGKVESNNDRV